MITPVPPQNVRIVHADDTSTPVEVEYVGPDPREVDGEIYIVDQWRVTTVLAPRPGDRLAYVLTNTRPCSVGFHRVGAR